MTNHEIDNSAQDYGKVVTWQYDKAYHLLLLLRTIKDYYDAGVSKFWDYWRKGVLSIDQADDFGVTLWGTFLGVPRPLISDGGASESGKRAIDFTTYRKLLKATFFLMYSNGSIRDIRHYLQIIFTPDGEGRYCGVSIKDGMDMSISYVKNDYFDEMTNDQQALFNECGDEILPYPLGIKSNDPVDERIFGFQGQENDELYKEHVAYKVGDIVGFEETPNGIAFNWECTKELSAAANTSWAAVRDKYFRKAFGGNAFVGSFCEETAEREWMTGVSYGVGDTVLYGNEVYVCVKACNVPQGASWGVFHWNFQKPWHRTTFISKTKQQSLLGMLLTGTLSIVDRNGNVTKTFNGVRNVSVSMDDFGDTYGMQIPLYRTDQSKREIDLSLDKAAQANGKSVFGNATIGDLVRYLGGTI